MRVVGILKFWLFLAVLAILAPSAFAKLHGPEAGEDPFPLLCTDFTGSWRADNGDRYMIQQRKCSFLKVQMFYNSSATETMNIVPDNRTRPGPSRGSQIRHRWNAPENATVLESHQRYIDGNVQVTEVVMFEQANDNLLLQTTYRTIENLDAPGQQPRHEYSQQVFRRTGGASGSGL